jgi:hypothetical protein
VLLDELVGFEEEVLQVPLPELLSSTKAPATSAYVDAPKTPTAMATTAANLSVLASSLQPKALKITETGYVASARKRV